jgi:predicted acyl esterase
MTIADFLNKAPAAEAVRAWLDYDRPAEYEALVSEIQVPTRDGSTLTCRLYQPGRNGKATGIEHPGIVMDFMPYDMTDMLRGLHECLAERGYNVLAGDVRGTAASDGEFTSWFPEREIEDNYDLIEWLASQPCSNGRIGQVGQSYGSITAYRTASAKPPHLRTIVPVHSPTDIYSEWVYPGGVPASVGAWWQNAAIVDEQGHASVLKCFQDNPTFNSYWKQVVTTNKLKDVDVPTLHIGGHFDIFKNGGYDALRQRPENTWLVYGPWTHESLLPVSTDADKSSDFLLARTVLAWMDHWLMDEPGAGLPPARVISYESTSDISEGVWSEFGTWPAPTATPRRLFLTPDGSLTDQAPENSESRYSVNPYDGPSSGPLGNRPHDTGQDQAASEICSERPDGRHGQRRRVFTLPAFESDSVVAGPVTLHLNASITASDTYFVSKFEVVTLDGQVLPIETGYLRAQLRSTLETPEEIVPNKPLTYTILLGEAHWRFKTGEQLRVTLSGGDFPKILPTAPAGIVTIHHGTDTYVEVPVLEA